MTYTQERLQKSKQKKELNDWVAEHYDELLDAARKMHSHPVDLVSHVYLRVERQDLGKVLQNPMGYWRTAMWNEAKRGTFAKLYRLHLPIVAEPVYEPSTNDAMYREQLELFMDRLSWFDRTVMRLYIEGYNMSDVARESGISASVIHLSLHRTRKKIQDAVSSLRSKGKSPVHL